MFIFLFENTIKCVILLDAIVKGIVFLIPFGDNSLSSYISNCSGMGLEGIRNRVESVDGLVRIMDDDGFKVFVTIPIK